MWPVTCIHGGVVLVSILTVFSGKLLCGDLSTLKREGVGGDLNPSPEPLKNHLTQVYIVIICLPSHVSRTVHDVTTGLILG